MNAIGKFSCRDGDVESFLKEKALDFDKRHISRTYLVIDREAYIGDKVMLLGYYTITIKTLDFGQNLSKSKIKRIGGFTSDITSTEAILIGQLGKDQNHKNAIDGKTIMDYAVETVYAIHNLAGRRIVFLECSDNDKIVKFYQDNGFIFLQSSDGGEYLQMIRYL